MTKTLLKDTLRSIASNKLRFLSIALIVALGVSFYVGINSASPAMKYEAVEYFSENNLADMEVTSPIGFTDKDIEQIKKLDNVTQVIGSQYVDGYATIGKDSVVNENGTELTCRVNLLDIEKARAFLNGENDPSYINRVALRDGRLPEKVGECLVDSTSAKLYPEIEIGKVLTVVNGDDGSKLSPVADSFTVVGIVDSPRYISSDKGQTKLGSGTLNAVIYATSEAFSDDSPNVLFVKSSHSDYWDCFSDEYRTYMYTLADEIKQISASVIDTRLADLKTEYTKKADDKTAEIEAYNKSSAKALTDKEKSIKEFKEYVENEDSVLTELKQKNESKTKSAASTLSTLENRLSTLNTAYEQHVKSRDSQSSEIKGYSELKKLYDDLEKKHSTKKIELDNLEADYQDKKTKLDSKSDEVKSIEARIKIYELKIQSLTSEISELEAEISAASSNVSTLSEKRDKCKATVSSLNAEISSLNAIINDSNADSMDKAIALEKRNSLRRELTAAENELNSVNSELSHYESVVSSGTASKKSKETDKSKTSTSLTQERAKLDTCKSEKAVLEAEYTSTQSSYSSAKSSYDADEQTLLKYESSMKELTKNQSGLTSLISQVEKEKQELDTLKISVTQAQINYTLAVRNGSLETQKAEYDLKVAKSRYGVVDSEYTELKNDIQAKKLLLSSELDSFKTTLANLSNLRWTTIRQDEFAGMDSLTVSLENMKSMSTVFPVVFFLTAMIAYFVIMVKNVEEERKNIGIFKALGYSNGSVVNKFFFYSLIAWAAGAVLGTVFGTCVFPFAICSIYNMSYSIPNAGTVFLAQYVLTGLGLSLVLTVFTTLIAVRRELHHNPATLLRPKDITYHRRNILEKIPSIWKRLSYGAVTVIRTVSRSRGRVAAGALGVACCTALILSSIGLISSVTDVAGTQYGDKGIFKYDVMFVLKTPQAQNAEILQSIRNDQRTEDALLICNKSAIASSADSQVKRTVNIISTQSTEDFSKVINFEVIQGQLDFDKDSAVITDKMATDIGISVGEKICLTLADGTAHTARVSGIIKNYTDHYVYMSSEAYRSVFEAEPQSKYILATAKSYVDRAEIRSLASTFLKEDIVTGASTAEDMADSINISIERIGFVVLVFVLSACLLALIVMYTNSNINLSERTREIANIKVIGLSDHEVLIYVIRENIISTVYGTVFGLIGGVFLHKALIGFISVDNIVYGNRIAWWGFFAAVLIIVLIALISALPIKLKINKINMAETLKEIE